MESRQCYPGIRILPVESPQVGVTIPSLLSILRGSLGRLFDGWMTQL